MTRDWGRERALREVWDSAEDARLEIAGDGGAGREELRDSRCEGLSIGVMSEASCGSGIVT